MPRRTATKTPVAIYCRLSKAKHTGDAGVSESIDRQRQACEELCQTKGFEVVEVFVDDDRSAYSGKPRPAYNELLKAIDTGVVRGVVAWHPDRLHRRPSELEDFIELVDRTEAVVETVSAGTYDLTTATGRMVARVVGATSRMESEQKSERIQLANAHRAQQGRSHVGGKRPFGFEPDGETVVAEEAEVVREVVKRVAAGDKLYAIAKDLHERGVQSVTGKALTPVTLKTIVNNPRYIGKLTKGGKVVGDAVWGPIVDEADFEAANLVLAKPGRTTNGGDTRRKHLLAGIVTCGHCGKVLRTLRRSNGVAVYVCQRSAQRDGCGKVSIVAQRVEEIVRDRALGLVVAATNVHAEIDDHEARRTAEERLARLATRRDELLGLFNEGVLSVDEFKRSRAQVDAQVEELTRARAEANLQHSLEGLPMDPDKLREAWDEGDLDFRRNIITGTIASIVVNPATTRGRTFDPTRVEVTAHDRQYGQGGIKPICPTCEKPINPADKNTVAAMRQWEDDDFEPAWFHAECWDPHAGGALYVRGRKRTKARAASVA